MTRKDIFSDLDGCDENFPGNFNDLDFCLRLRERGWPLSGHHMQF
jgi:GT2 family glycosyltransferase